MGLWKCNVRHRQKQRHRNPLILHPSLVLILISVSLLLTVLPFLFLLSRLDVGLGLATLRLLGARISDSLEHSSHILRVDGNCEEEEFTIESLQAMLPSGRIAKQLDIEQDDGELLIHDTYHVITLEWIERHRQRHAERINRAQASTEMNIDAPY